MAKGDMQELPQEKEKGQGEEVKNQPLVMDGKVIRFKKNEIVEFLLDKGSYTLNDLAIRRFSDEDRAQFAQLIGYSVSGWGDLSYVKRADAIRADKMAERFWKKVKK